MSKLDQVVFVVKNNEIVERKIRDLDGYIDETTTPLGVGPRLHIREYPKFSIDGNDFKSREKAEEYAADQQLQTISISEGTSYQLWSWGFNGNNPHLIYSLETEEEAREELENFFYQDFRECFDICAFFSKSDAEQFIAELQDL